MEPDVEVAFIAGEAGAKGWRNYGRIMQTVFCSGVPTVQVISSGRTLRTFWGRLKGPGKMGGSSLLNLIDDDALTSTSFQTHRPELV